MESKLDDILEFDSRKILEEYSKKVFSEITGKEINFNLEINEDGIMKISNANEEDYKILINIISTMKLRELHLTDEEYDSEEKQGIGSVLNRSSRSYLTH